jgi:hypothetical protein
LRYRMQLSIQVDDNGQPGQTVLSLDQPTVALAGKALSLNYAPASATTDQAALLAAIANTVDSFNDLPEGLPAYLIEYPLRVMLRLHLIQNWYAMSDRGLEDALYEITSLRQFAGLNLLDAMPDETTILNFRRLLETHALGPAILATVNEVLRA